jgi:diguanylate cyclase (GGDEF)-like protein
MMRWFRNLRIANKLFLLIVLINVTALSVSGAFLAVYTWHSLHDDIVEQLKRRTEIVAAANLTAALSFKDKRAAQDALSALCADKNTLAAAVYDAQGTVFAVYPEPTEGLKNIGAPLRQNYKFVADELFIKQPVILDNENIGYLVLQYSRQEINQKFWYFLRVIVGFLSAAALLSCLLTSFLQHHITQPIQALSALTLKIVEQEDYSVRAQPRGKDEVGELTRHINAMLARIESRDAQLEQYNKELENMVVKRTEQLERINNSLEHRARHDVLTNLPNRVLFADRLRQAIFTADRNGGKVAVLFVDLDYFKQINDSYGHEAGDQVLLQVAKRMEGSVRSVDTVSRFAGDEFTLILPNINSAQDLNQVAAKLRHELDRPVAFNALSLNISASIGGAIYPDDADDMELLLQAADQAMYHAKTQGRNCFQLYSDSMNERVVKRRQLQSDLKKALANDEFVILYQPVVDLATGRLDSLESLLRWQNPQLGLLTPDNFLAAAKENGLITEIDKHMLLKVSGQIEDWRRKGLTATIRINLALRDFLSTDFFQLFFELIEKGRIEPAMLSLEIEESVLRSDSPQVIRMLDKLKETAVGISIDNFGTEYASLLTLLRGRIQYVKIDRSYFQRNASNSERFRLIQALIVAMAHSLDVKVIAAGVETEKQREFLEKIGCDLAQGYLFHRPMLSPEAEELLENAGLSV